MILGNKHQTTKRGEFDGGKKYRKITALELNRKNEEASKKRTWKVFSTSKRSGKKATK